MRRYHVMATLAVLAIGFAIKVFFFQKPVAEAHLQPGATHSEAGAYLRDIHARLNIQALPVQNILSEADPDLEDSNTATNLPH
jgi:hypothetical protein